MEVRQYRIFKEVAETGSFTKAAANLYITQSGFGGEGGNGPV